MDTPDGIGALSPHRVLDLTIHRARPSRQTLAGLGANMMESTRQEATA